MVRRWILARKKIECFLDWRKNAVTSQDNENARKLLERLNLIKIADLDDIEVEYEYQQSQI